MQKIVEIKEERKDSILRELEEYGVSRVIERLTEEEVIAMTETYSAHNYSPLPVVVDMITLTINAFNKPSKDIIERIIELEKSVDELYREAIEKTHTSANTCSCIDLVTVIFLERMADHGSYIAQKLMETMKS